MITLKQISQSKSFGGYQAVFSHTSETLGCEMRFGVYLPPLAATQNVPVLYWLSGLTCTEENFITKAGSQRIAAELGLALVVPDTSPRGLNIPGDATSYDIGTGASFYVDATVAPWAKNYRMYSYLTAELPVLIRENFAVDSKRMGIFGHSMGGHGALTIALKNPDDYKSVSALAPISSLTHCAWGEKALTAYLGNDQKTWRDYDAALLVKTRGWMGPDILIDQGDSDAFLVDYLKPELFKAACADAGVKLNLRMQQGYDHSYYFVATFMEDHLRFHAMNLVSL